MNSQIQELDDVATSSDAVLQKPVFTTQDVDFAIESHRLSKDWFAVVTTINGQQHVYDKAQVVDELRSSIVSGELNADSTIGIHSQAKDLSWSEAMLSVSKFAKGHFRLRILFEPVWGHAMVGLKWGALGGIGLKLLDTLLMLGSVNPGSAFLFLVAIVVCCIPRIGVVGVAMVSFMMMKYSKVNFFIIGLSAALIGAILGCLPGMAIGGVIGLARRTMLPVAKDAKPETKSVLLKAIVFPLIGGAGIWCFYLLVFNPWLMKVME